VGLYRDGGTPKSGLNFDGDCGGELVVINWCGLSAFVSGAEAVCAPTSVALKQKTPVADGWIKLAAEKVSRVPTKVSPLPKGEGQGEGKPRLMTKRRVILSRVHFVSTNPATLE